MLTFIFQILCEIPAGLGVVRTCHSSKRTFEGSGNCLMIFFLQNLPNGLRAAAQRGLVAVFATLSRKCPASRLGKQDEMGLSLMHHAAMWNRPQIIAVLILLSMDVNVRRNNNILTSGTFYTNASS